MNLPQSHGSVNELRAELSLPEGIQGGKGTGWRVRVLLPPHMFNDAIEEIPDRNEENDVYFYLSEA